MAFGGPVDAGSLSTGIGSAALDLAAALDQNPQAQTKLQNFIALPADHRKQLLQRRLDENLQWRTTIEQKQNTPEGQQKIQMPVRIAATCIAVLRITLMHFSNRIRVIKHTLIVPRGRLNSVRCAGNSAE